MKTGSPRGSDNVRVVCRARPMNDKEKELASLSSRATCTEFNPADHRAVTIYTPLEKPERDKPPFDHHSFNFDHVFDSDAKQSEVYEVVGKPIIESLMEGFNGCVLAYGQTSSGKTYTMQGDLDDEDVKGLVPRLVGELFDKIEEASEAIEFVIGVAMIEIYNEKIKDLLDPSKDNLSVREERIRGVFVENLTEVSIGTAEDIYKLMKRGNNNRAVGVTNMNAQSSRSHSILTLRITMNDTENFSCKTGKVYLVDLAGSEVVGKTGATGKTLEEAKNINKSLTVLGRVINALTDGKSEYIPYRDSKLTRILQNSLGGNSKTCLVITVSPAMYNAAETLSTCRFGMRAKSIKNKAVVNKIPSISELQLTIKKLQEEVNASYNKISKLEAQVIALGGTVIPEETEPIEEEALLEDEFAKPHSRIDKVKGDNKRMAMAKMELQRKSELNKEINELEKEHAIDVDTLLQELKKERQMIKEKNQTLIELHALVTERTKEIDRIKKNIADHESILEPEKEELKKLEEDKSLFEESADEKIYTPEEHEEIVKKTRGEYENEYRKILAKASILTDQNIQLMMANEELAKRIKELQKAQANSKTAKKILAYQENLSKLNQLYHHQLNQYATSKYNLEIQGDILKRALESKGDMEKQIAIMKTQIDSLQIQCAKLKSYLHDEPEIKRVKSEVGTALADLLIDDVDFNEINSGKKCFDNCVLVNGVT
eukprot:TRINITY_DN17208_c0_g1_i3.p1 TRINITY_DN17208_c0_g1~~TRINITY_DN17208_c0_g1_i3.p1  ORF type:complete len:716 (-),score=267.91 TRINITY_DN17208_c0_g1_i3:108-2255(-)